MREKLIEILERAGSMRQFPGSLSRILMENGVTIPVRCKDCAKTWCYLRQELGADGYCSAAIDNNLTVGERIAAHLQRLDEIDFDYAADDVK